MSIIEGSLLIYNLEAVAACSKIAKGLALVHFQKYWLLIHCRISDDMHSLVSVRMCGICLENRVDWVAARKMLFPQDSREL